MALRDEILSKYERKPQKVAALDGLGVYVLPLSVADLLDIKPGSDGYALAIARGCCDDKGARVFSDEDVARIKGLDEAFTKPVNDALMALVRAPEGKAEAIPAGGSPSA